MIIKIYDDGHIAEILIKLTVKPVTTTDELVRTMLQHGITAAKIIRIQTAKESPPPRFDQEGGGPATS